MALRSRSLRVRALLGLAVVVVMVAGGVLAALSTVIPAEQHGRAAMLATAVATLVLLAGMVLLFQWGKRFQRRVDRLVSDAQALASDALDRPVAAVTGELAPVAAALEQARLGRKGQLAAAAASARGEAEEQTMAQVREALMDHAIPLSERFQFAAEHRTGPTMGGDWYGWLPGAGDRLYLVVGDVTGHGVAATMVAAAARSAASALVRRDRDGGVATLSPARLLAQLHQELRFIADGKHSMKCLVAQLDTQSGRLQLASAAHAQPLVARADGSVSVLEVTGPVLGEDPSVTHAEVDAWLNAGDTLMLYSDGLVEARDNRDRDFGRRRLLETFTLACAGTADQVAGTLIETAAAFHADPRIRDDMTVAVIRALD